MCSSDLRTALIIFIIAVLSVVNDPDDMINRALMLRSYLMAKGDDEFEKVPLYSDKLIEESKIYFPAEYEGFLDKVKQMSLFEATEDIISFFNLGDYSWNVAYLNTFQDYIVSFTGNKNADIR